MWFPNFLWQQSNRTLIRLNFKHPRSKYSNKQGLGLQQRLGWKKHAGEQERHLLAINSSSGCLTALRTYLIWTPTTKYSNNGRNTAVQQWMLTVQSELFTDNEHYHLIINNVKITFITPTVHVLRTGLRITFSYL